MKQLLMTGLFAASLLTMEAQKKTKTTNTQQKKTF